MSDFEATMESRFKDWHYNHPLVLQGLVRSLKPAVIVEVGTYRGYAACYMARGLQLNNTGHLFCIDNFSLREHVENYGDPEAHWEENLRYAGIRDFVTLLKGDSDKVQWPEKVDFAYIDGWHSYEMCKRDTEDAMARGAEVIAIDDVISCVGPRQYFSELQYDKNWDTCIIHRDAGLGLAVRRQVLPRVLYVQERSDHPGMDVQHLSDEEALKYLGETSDITGVEYHGMLGTTQYEIEIAPPITTLVDGSGKVWGLERIPDVVPVPEVKRRWGRPLGSKNKPK